MTIFDPLDLETYRKTNPPTDDRSKAEYLDQQLRNIERAISHLNAAVDQLQDTEVATQGGLMFRAYKTGAQSIANATYTKLTYDAEDLDSDGAFDLTTDRFTPTVAGYYHIGGNMMLASVAGGNNALSLLQNGGEVFRFSQGSLYTGSGSYLVHANGTSDYFELWGYQATGGAYNIDQSIFWGYLVRPD